MTLVLIYRMRAFARQLAYPRALRSCAQAASRQNCRPRDPFHREAARSGDARRGGDDVVADSNQQSAIELSYQQSVISCQFGSFRLKAEATKKDKYPSSHVPSPQFPVPSPQFPVPSFQFPSSQFRVPSSEFQFRVPSSRPQFPVPSSQFPVPSSQFPVPSSQFPVPIPVPSPQFPVPVSSS